jgi:hypothetical protein
MELVDHGDVTEADELCCRIIGVDSATIFPRQAAFQTNAIVDLAEALQMGNLVQVAVRSAIAVTIQALAGIHTPPARSYG